MSDAGGATPTQPYGQPAAPPPEERQARASRRGIALAQRAGGAVAPLLTVLLAFVMGGLVVLVTTGKNPLNTYRAIFDGSGLNWFFRPLGRPARTRAVQPPADADLDDDADPRRARGRVRVPLRPVQHRRPGPVPRGRDPRRLDRLVVRGHEPDPARPARARGRHAGGRARRRHRGLPEGDGRRPRGDHDDHAQLDRRLRRHVPVRARRAAAERHASSRRPDLERRRRGGEAARLLGRPAAPGPPHRLLHRHRRARRLLDRSSTARRSATASRRSASTPRPRATAGISVARNYFLAMAISGAFAGLAGAIDILGWQFRLSTSDVAGVVVGDRVRRHRRRAARPQHGRRASPSRRCSSARSSPGRRPATSTRRSSSPSSRRT